MRLRTGAATGLAVLAGACAAVGSAAPVAQANCGSVLRLTPATQTHNVGETATVQGELLAKCRLPERSPFGDQPVKFTVTSGPNAGKTFTGNTNGNGIVNFTYTSEVRGTDSVTASYTAPVPSDSSTADAPVSVIWKAPQLAVTCRASALRADVLSAIGLPLLRLEPSVSNPPDDPCADDDSGQSLSLPGLIRVGLLETRTRNAPEAGVAARSRAELTSVAVPVVRNLRAAAVTSRATARCVDGSLEFQTASRLVDATIAGRDISGTEPLTINLGGGNVVFVNRRIDTADGVVQRAIDVRLNGREVLVLGEAKVGRSATQQPGAAC